MQVKELSPKSPKMGTVTHILCCTVSWHKKSCQSHSYVWLFFFFFFETLTGLIRSNLKNKHKLNIQNLLLQLEVMTGNCLCQLSSRSRQLHWFYFHQPWTERVKETILFEIAPACFWKSLVCGWHTARATRAFSSWRLTTWSTLPEHDINDSDLR